MRKRTPSKTDRTARNIRPSGYLCAGIELARQERANAQQRVGHLEKELWRERDLKVAIKGVSTGLAMEVRQCQEEVRRLEAEVTWQRDEVRRLWADVNGKS